MEMQDIKEYVSVQSPTKVNFVDAKSQTPHVSNVFSNVCESNKLVGYGT